MPAGSRPVCDIRFGLCVPGAMKFTLERPVIGTAWPKGDFEAIGMSCLGPAARSSVAGSLHQPSGLVSCRRGELQDGRVGSACMAFGAGFGVPACIASGESRSSAHSE